MTLCRVVSIQETIMFMIVFVYCISAVYCNNYDNNNSNENNTINVNNNNDNNNNNDDRPATGIEQDYVFAMIPKSISNPFFDLTREGCEIQAIRLQITKCIWVGPDIEDEQGLMQAQVLQELLFNSTQPESEAFNLRGVAISITNQDSILPLLQQAVEEYNIPIVTFDSDAPDSNYVSNYIGTNNTFFGLELGKVVKQLLPNGGTFGILSGSSPNIQQREIGLRRELIASLSGFNANYKDNHQQQRQQEWKEIETSPQYYHGQNVTLAIERMYDLANNNFQQPPTVIIPVYGAPMRSGYWKQFVDSTAFPKNITIVSGDAFSIQLEFLNRGYAHGLVGQVPFEMGVHAMSQLLQLNRHLQQQQQQSSSSLNIDILKRDNPKNPFFIGTNVITHIYVPLILPELTVDHNLIGDLAVVGYIFFGIVCCCCIWCSVWTIRNRKIHVIQVAQPLFLLMIVVGVLIMASSMIPLGLDDHGIIQRQPAASSSSTALLDEEHSNHDYPNGASSCFSSRSSCVWICMSVPWLCCMGFTLTFSALYSKQKRINQLFLSTRSFSRITVKERDVAAPSIVLLLANIVVLTLWTIIDPLIYTRATQEGLDGWNRIIATYGGCRSNTTASYLIPLAIINASVLISANWQAYQGRLLETEFSEAKYIGLSMASMLQALLSGVPILFVVREFPKAFYLVSIFMIFITCMAILLVMFIPKMIFADEFSRRPTIDQRQWLRNAIHTSVRRQSHGMMMMASSEMGIELAAAAAAAAATTTQEEDLELLQQRQQQYERHYDDDNNNNSNDNNNNPNRDNDRINRTNNNDNNVDAEQPPQGGRGGRRRSPLYTAVNNHQSTNNDTTDTTNNDDDHDNNYNNFGNPIGGTFNPLTSSTAAANGSSNHVSSNDNNNYNNMDDNDTISHTGTETEAGTISNNTAIPATSTLSPLATKSSIVPTSQQPIEQTENNANNDTKINENQQLKNHHLQQQQQRRAIKFSIPSNPLQLLSSSKRRQQQQTRKEQSRSESQVVQSPRGESHQSESISLSPSQQFYSETSSIIHA